MHAKILTLLAVFIHVFTTTGYGRAPNWNSRLKQNPRITSGVLRNGLRYYIFPTQTQPHKVSVRLLVNAGSAMETPEENGLAHFIEHMTFNGSVHFKPGTLIHYFQDNGMGFGNDTNAFTTYLHTCYQIDLPKNDDANIGKALQVLWDQGFGCLFLPDEIQRERGVILSEMNARDSVAYQTTKAFFTFIGANTFLERFCIGTKENINRFQASDFFKFYQKWYTLNRMSLIISGDCIPKNIINELEKIFATKPSLSKPSKETAEDPTLCIRKPANGFEVSVFSHHELPDVSVTLLGQRNIPARFPTLDTFKEFAAWQLMQILIQQRLEELKNKSCLTQCLFDHSIDFKTLENASLSFSGSVADTKVIVEALEKFYRSVTTFGFTQKELNSAKTILAGRLKLELDDEANASPKDIADKIVYALMTSPIVVSPQQRLQHLETVFPYITPAYCETLWRNLFADGLFLFISTPDAKTNAQGIKQYYDASQKTVLALPESLKQSSFQSVIQNVRDSKIIDTRFHKNLEVESIRLDNNVRINLKKTDFDKNRILVHVSLGYGLMDFIHTPYPGLNLFLTSSFVASGLKQCDHATLNRIFDGKCINLDFDVEDDSYTFKSFTNRECLKEQLQLICAYILKPGYRQESMENFRKTIAVWYDYFAHTCEGTFKFMVPKFLAQNDVRYGYPAKDVLLQRTLQEAEKILTPVFDKQYLEITLIGDFDRDETVKTLQETFGQLSQRDPNKEVPDALRTLPLPPAQTKVFTCQTNIEKAIIHVVWPTESIWNITHVRALNIVKDALRDRLLQAIRQKQGDTYSPQTQSVQSETFTNRGYISATLVVQPQKLDAISDQILAIADDMAKTGITQTEFERALKPIISSWEKLSKTNVFWLNLIKNLQQYPEKQQWDLWKTDPYYKLTLDDINQLIRKYLKRTSAICIQIKPEAKKV